MYVVYLVYSMVLLVGIVFCFFFSFFLLGRFVGRWREREIELGRRFVLLVQFLYRGRWKL